MGPTGFLRPPVHSKPARKSETGNFPRAAMWKVSKESLAFAPWRHTMMLLEELRPLAASFQRVYRMTR